MCAKVSKVYRAEALLWLSMVGLIVTLALASLLAPLAGEAQQTSKVRRIGWLTPGAPPPAGASSHFEQILRELGWVEGQNLAIEPRYAAGRLDQLPDLAAELVRLPVELIVVVSFPAALAAKHATTTIPIVIARGGDLVDTKLVASLARPGGNITGVSIPENELAGKRLQLLMEAVPGISRVAVIWNMVDLAMSLRFSATQDAAHALGLKLQPLGVQEPRDFHAAFVTMGRERPDALFVVSDVLTLQNQQHIVAFTAQHRLPAMYEFRSDVAAGGLLSYGPSVAEMSRRAATLVDKILKGAKPADLPVEQPMKSELVINLKTAQTLGLTIPPMVLFQADEVIK
jgi:putative tryptophan/tyrosine transport system substrate-binding protein